jgi:hypothetical protein
MQVWVQNSIFFLPFQEEFVDEGAETNFEVPGAPNHCAKILAVSSGKQSQGIVHSLIINDEVIPESRNS